MSESEDEWIVDDPSIPDATWTYRNFPRQPTFLVPDALGGPPHLATSVFSYGTADGMSVSLSHLMAHEGIGPQDLVSDWATHHVARVAVNTVRHNDSVRGGVVASVGDASLEERVARSHGLVRVALRPGPREAKRLWNDLRLEMLKASDYLLCSAGSWSPQPETDASG